MSETGKGTDLASAYKSLLTSLKANGELSDEAASHLQDAYAKLDEKSQHGSTDTTVTSGAMIVQAGGPLNFEAISFCRKIGAPFFLVCVLKDIRRSNPGWVEFAFLQELANKATVGGNSPIMVHQEASSLTKLHGRDLELVRSVVWAARDYILNANQHRRPDALYAECPRYLDRGSGCARSRWRGDERDFDLTDEGTRFGAHGIEADINQPKSRDESVENDPWLTSLR